MEIEFAEFFFFPGIIGDVFEVEVIVPCPVEEGEERERQEAYGKEYEDRLSQKTKFPEEKEKGAPAKSDCIKEESAGQDSHSPKDS